MWSLQPEDREPFSDSFRGYCAGYNFAFIDNNAYRYVGHNTE